MTATAIIVLCLAAFLAGAINSVAGGGTLLTFPALFALLGQSPDAAVIANATSSAALLPGSASGAWGYRREMKTAGPWMAWLLPPSLLGGWLGARLLTSMPAEYFQRLVPWLLLTATLLFALQPLALRWLGFGEPQQRPTKRRLIAVAVVQLLFSIYGGYFGAGNGILMLSALALAGLTNIHLMNGLKSVLATAINGIAVIEFIVAGKVVWPLAWPMAIAAIIGGYAGASIARRLDRNVVRAAIIAIGFILAAYFFAKQL